MFFAFLFWAQRICGSGEFPDWLKMEKFLDDLLSFDEIPLHSAVHAADIPLHSRVHAEVDTTETVHEVDIPLHSGMHAAEIPLHSAVYAAEDTTEDVHAVDIPLHNAVHATEIPLHNAVHAPPAESDEEMAREFLSSAKRFLLGDLPSSPKSVRHRIKSLTEYIDRMHRILMNMDLPLTLREQITDCKTGLEAQISELQAVKSKGNCLEIAVREVRNFSVEFTEDFNLGFFTNPGKAATAHAFLDKWLAHFLTLDDSKLSATDREVVSRMSDSLVGLKRVLSDQDGSDVAVSTGRSINVEFEVASWSAGFARLEDMEDDDGGNVIAILADMCRSFLTVTIAAHENDNVNMTKQLRVMRRQLGELVPLIESWRIRQLSRDSRSDEQRMYKSATNWSTMMGLEMGFIGRAKDLASSPNMTALQLSAAALCVESVRAIVDHYWMGKAPRKLIDSLRRQIYITERRLFNNIP